MGHTITDNQGNDIIVINLAADTYEDIVLGIMLPENVEAGNQTVYLRVSEEGVDSDEARYFDLPVTVMVEEDVQLDVCQSLKRANTLDFLQMKPEISNLGFLMITTYLST